MPTASAGKRTSSTGVAPHSVEQIKKGASLFLGQCTETKENAYFVYAKIGKQKVAMLLDSGCSRSIMPTKVLKQLARDCHSQLKPVSIHGVLADGQCIDLQGETEVTITLGGMQYSATFLIAYINKHVLLRLDFFMRNRCTVDFKCSQLVIGQQRMDCCDAMGSPITAKVQSMSDVTIPALGECMIPARLNRVLTSDLARVEDYGITPGLRVAATLHQPEQQSLLVRVLNVTSFAIITSLPEILESALQEWCCRLSPHQTQQVRQLLLRHQQVFSLDKYDIGCTTAVQHSILLVEGARPVKQRPYRHGHVQEEEIERQVQEVKTHGLVKEGYGAWSSPVVLVQKKDNSWRLCIDYRKLNDVTIKDAYPLPCIDDSLDALGGSNYFSTLDLTSGYWQVELEDEAKEKSAFVTR